MSLDGANPGNYVMQPEISRQTDAALHWLSINYSTFIFWKISFETYCFIHFSSVTPILKAHEIPFDLR